MNDNCRSVDTVGFHNFNLRIFNLRVSNPNKSIVDVLSTRCRISMCQGLGPKKHDEISEIDRTPFSPHRSEFDRRPPTGNPAIWWKTEVPLSKVPPLKLDRESHDLEEDRCTPGKSVPRKTIVFGYCRQLAFDGFRKVQRKSRILYLGGQHLSLPEQPL